MSASTVPADAEIGGVDGVVCAKAAGLLIKTAEKARGPASRRVIDRVAPETERAQEPRREAVQTGALARSVIAKTGSAQE
jgi:hypothetical protein